MKKFLVTIDWSGYSRGYTEYEVMAESEEEASNIWYSGIEVSHEVTRDDTEKEVDSVEEI